MEVLVEAGSNRVYVAQGQYAVTEGADMQISAILGSCVACCLWDERLGVGGMNHVLLPGVESGDLRSEATGLQLMELLINGLLKRGAMKSSLRAKIFGGASVVAGLSDAGMRNIKFVKQFLDTEGIPCVGESTGGDIARRIEFWPSTGRARQKFVDSKRVEKTPAPAAPDPGNDVELF